ncbi:MAG: ECF transporter S component [Oscillospiraceae bacterium]|jgi:uncharacterized membrane protein
MRSKSQTVNLALTGLMAALVFVATMFFKVQIPIGEDKTMVGFANVFCILSGLLLGPLYGGLAAGIGSALFDLVGGWASSAPVTLVTKFAMAWICGLIVWHGAEGTKKLSRVIVGAVTGSLSYSALYMAYSALKAVLLGSAEQTIQIVLLTKLGATLTNAVLADVIAIPLYFAVRKALARSFPQARGNE